MPVLQVSSLSLNFFLVLLKSVFIIGSKIVLFHSTVLYSIFLSLIHMVCMLLFTAAIVMIV